MGVVTMSGRLIESVQKAFAQYLHTLGRVEGVVDDLALYGRERRMVKDQIERLIDALALGVIELVDAHPPVLTAVPESVTGYEVRCGCGCFEPWAEHFEHFLRDAILEGRSS